MTTTQIERVISLPEAAARTGLSSKTLTRLISDGMMRAVQLPDGSVAVSESEAHKVAQQIAVNEQLKGVNREQFKKLRGRAITYSQASGDYSVPGTTIRDWVKRGFVRVLHPDSYPAELDQADVAYCAAIYRIRSAFGVLGVPLLDEQGLPYQLRRPQLAEYRRRKKGGNGIPRPLPSRGNGAPVK